MNQRAGSESLRGCGEHRHWEAFQIVDAEGRSVVEPGEFEILVGPSSKDGYLLKLTLPPE